MFYLSLYCFANYIDWSETDFHSRMAEKVKDVFSAQGFPNVRWAGIQNVLGDFII